MYRIKLAQDSGQWRIEPSSFINCVEYTYVVVNMGSAACSQQLVAATNWNVILARLLTVADEHNMLLAVA
jgi:hypothetical protein